MNLRLKNFRMPLLSISIACIALSAGAADYEVKPLSEQQMKGYLVDGSFYKKGIVVHDILIANACTVYRT